MNVPLGDHQPELEIPDGFLTAQALSARMQAAQLNDWHVIEIIDIYNSAAYIEELELLRYAHDNQQSVIADLGSAAVSNTRLVEHARALSSAIEQSYTTVLDESLEEINTYLFDHPGIVRGLIDAKSNDWAAITSLAQKDVSPLPEVAFMVENELHDSFAVIRYDAGRLTEGEKRALLGYTSNK